MSTKLLQVILQPNYDGSIMPKQKIVYNNSSLILTDAERASLESELPDFWHTSKDVLVRFEKYDNSYFCERYKDYFDYSTRETNKKMYKFDVASEEQVQQLYVFFLNQYTKIKIARVENLYQSIENNIGDLSYVKYSLLESRDKLLKESDYTQMPDYPIDDLTKEIWKKYRQDLRDLTSQQAWIDGDLINVVMPVSPEPNSQLDTLREELGGIQAMPQDLFDGELQSVLSGDISTVVRKISEVTVKFELLKSLGKLKIPMFDLDYTALQNSQDYFDESVYNIKQEVEEESLLPADWWEAATANLDNLIANINDKLSVYNINFTINDVLQSLMRKNMEIQQTENLLNSLEQEESN